MRITQEREEEEEEEGCTREGPSGVLLITVTNAFTSASVPQERPHVTFRRPRSVDLLWNSGFVAVCSRIHIPAGSGTHDWIRTL